MGRPNLASIEMCTACMACIDACPKSALTSVLNDNGRYQIECDTDSCISCGLCERVCPVVTLQFGKRKKGTSYPFAAWAIDEGLRLKSASGGIFAALAYQVISNGGVAIGACMDGLEVKMKLIDKIEDISLLQGSKYQQANSCGIYSLVKTLLRRGEKVLFSGTPCQIAALYSFLGKTSTDNLVTLDFICSGLPSILPLQYELKKRGEGIRTLTFTDKANGWLKSKSLNLYDNNGRVINIGWNNGISNAFSSKLTHRGSCVDCCFCHPERISDLTVGDFWGDKEFVSEHEKGLSIVIVHSPKGKKELDLSSIELRSVTWKSFLMANPRMIYGKLLSAKYHPLRRHTAHYYEKKSLKDIERLFVFPWGKNMVSVILYRVFQLLFYTYPLNRRKKKIIKKNDK